MSEFSIIFLSGFIISTGGFFFRCVASEISIFTANPNENLPSFIRSIPRNSFVLGGFIRSLSRITAVLCTRAFTKIVPAIVERVVVPMVALFSRFAIKDKHMHSDMLAVNFSSRIKTANFGTPRRTPIKTVQPIEVSGIHDCILATRKRDKAVGFVKRLNNLVSFHAVFHWPSFKGLLKFSRHFTTVCTLLLAAILLTASRAEAGPLDWVKHHKRFLLMEGAAIGAASIHAYGLHHCRQTGVENCQAKYGSAWTSFGIITGMNVIVMPSLAEGCWKNEGGKFCNVLAYGGSAGQAGFGIAQWRKEKHAETNLRIHDHR